MLSTPPLSTKQSLDVPPYPPIFVAVVTQLINHLAARTPADVHGHSSDVSLCAIPRPTGFADMAPAKLVVILMARHLGRRHISLNPPSTRIGGDQLTHPHLRRADPHRLLSRSPDQPESVISRMVHRGPAA